MTDFIIVDSDEIEQYESILINVFYKILNYDYRCGMFTNESSIYDMGGTGLSNEDYRAIATRYNIEAPDNLSYTDGQNFYFKLLNGAFDEMLCEKFKMVYNIDFDLKKPNLVDIAKLLKETFPTRNWEQENIFIIKTLDNQALREEKQKDLEKSSKVEKIPVRKKPTPEEIKESVNDYLMVTVLGMSVEDARVLADANYQKRVAGKKYTPYMPDDDLSYN